MDLTTAVRRLVVPAVLVLSLAAAAAAADAGNRTTGPGVIAHVPIVLTAGKIDIPKDQFVTKAEPNVARYPRGAQIDFRIQNKGSKPAILSLRVLSKLNFYGANQLKKLVSTRKPVKPGTTAHMRLSFYFRARFMFEERVNGKVVARHEMVIF